MLEWCLILTQNGQEYRDSLTYDISSHANTALLDDQFHKVEKEEVAVFPSFTLPRTLKHVANIFKNFQIIWWFPPEKKSEWICLAV